MLCRLILVRENSRTIEWNWSTLLTLNITLDLPFLVIWKRGYLHDSSVEQQQNWVKKDCRSLDKQDLQKIWVTLSRDSPMQIRVGFPPRWVNVGWHLNWGGKLPFYFKKCVCCKFVFEWNRGITRFTLAHTDEKTELSQPVLKIPKLGRWGVDQDSCPILFSGYHGKLPPSNPMAPSSQLPGDKILSFSNVSYLGSYNLFQDVNPSAHFLMHILYNN